MELDREIILGLKNATSLFSAMLQFSIASELMLIGLTEEFERDRDVISLHPGVVKTELHRGQGVFFDLLAHLMYFVQGISLEESGLFLFCPIKNFEDFYSLLIPFVKKREMTI